MVQMAYREKSPLGLMGMLREWIVETRVAAKALRFSQAVRAWWWEESVAAGRGISSLSSKNALPVLLMF